MDFIDLDIGGDAHALLRAAEQKRFGLWRVRYDGLVIHCADLLSLYHSLVSIFLDRIYDFNSAAASPYIIDGGAHIGLFTLFAKRRFPGAKLVAFEPDPVNLTFLRLNLEQNSVRGVDVVTSGLDSHDGALPFHSDSTDGGSFLEGQGDTLLPVCRLSQWLPHGADMVKLNIEGAESRVIEEIRPVLHTVENISLEYHAFQELEQTLHLILDALNQSGFRYLVRHYCPGTPANLTELTAEVPFFNIVSAKRFGARQ